MTRTLAKSEVLVNFPKRLYWSNLEEQKDRMKTFHALKTVVYLSHEILSGKAAIICLIPHLGEFPRS